MSGVLYKTIELSDEQNNDFIMKQMSQIFIIFATKYVLK